VDDDGGHARRLAAATNSDRDGPGPTSAECGLDDDEQPAITAIDAAAITSRRNITIGS
jgi:hypothetical protein